MKFTLVLCGLIAFSTVAQKVVPFVDFNNYFRSFQDNNFRQIEFQEIIEYKAGDDLVAYLDTRGNLRVFDGTERKDISPMRVNYQVSDHLLAYNIGPTLNIWDEGALRTLTYFSRNYWVKDSLIVYEDTRFNSVNVYWNKQVYPIYQLTGELYAPEAIGENVVVFKDNGNVFKIFWNGEIYEIDGWNGTMDFGVGTDLVCFNDPNTRTFAVFDKGAFTDVEQQFLTKYKAGRGFVVFEDPNTNLTYYSNGQTIPLSNFSANFWDVKDDLVVWRENSFVFAYQNGTKIQVSNFTPKDYKIKNNVYAFRNILGGVSALVDGQVYEITNQADAEYDIFGNVVLVKLFNRSYIVFKDGRKFSN
jgi:hypothetical protein